MARCELFIDGQVTRRAGTPSAEGAYVCLRLPTSAYAGFAGPERLPYVPCMDESSGLTAAAAPSRRDASSTGNARPVAAPGDRTRNSVAPRADRRSKPKFECAGCLEQFEGLETFDRHRIGRQDVRHCRTPDTMRSLGWVLNWRGGWIDPRRAERGRRLGTRNAREASTNKGRVRQ